MLSVKDVIDIFVDTIWEENIDTHHRNIVQCVTFMNCFDASDVGINK